MDLNLQIKPKAEDSLVASYTCPCGCNPRLGYAKGEGHAQDGCCCGNEFAVGPDAAGRLHAHDGFRQEVQVFQAPWGEPLQAVWTIGASVDPNAPADDHGHDHAHGHDGDAPTTAIDPVCGMTVDRAAATAHGLRDEQHAYIERAVRFSEDMRVRHALARRARTYLPAQGGEPLAWRDGCTAQRDPSHDVESASCRAAAMIVGSQHTPLPCSRGAHMRPVPEFDPRGWLLKALRETAHAMESLLWNLDEDALDRRPAEDEWSCLELVSHMTEMERRYVERLERIVRLDEPRIAAFDGDSIEREVPLDGATAFDLMEEFGVLRRQAVYLLWSLDDRDWERKGVHPYLGALTITQAAREMNEHDLAHLWQLRRLCDAFSPASV